MHISLPSPPQSSSQVPPSRCASASSRVLGIQRSRIPRGVAELDAVQEQLTGRLGTCLSTSMKVSRSIVVGVEVVVGLLGAEGGCYEWRECE